MSGYFLLEKVLFGLFNSYLQGEHNLKDAKIELLEMPLHKESMQVQELLSVQKVNLLDAVNRSKHVSLQQFAHACETLSSCLDLA